MRYHMKVVKNENIRPFDVDSTLIYPNSPENENLPPVLIFDPVERRYITLRYNINMVRLLKEEHQRGSYVIVWSRGGWEWARNAVIALELQEYVDRVMSKPLAYFDDQPVETWMKDRIYLEPNMAYKR